MSFINNSGTSPISLVVIIDRIVKLGDRSAINLWNSCTRSEWQMLKSTEKVHILYHHWCLEQGKVTSRRIIYLFSVAYTFVCEENKCKVKRQIELYVKAKQLKFVVEWKMKHILKPMSIFIYMICTNDIFLLFFFYFIFSALP